MAENPAPMNSPTRILIAASVGFVGLSAAFGLGVWTATGQTADDMDKYALSLASTVGGWVSGIGTLAAVIAALYIANRQVAETRRLAKWAHQEDAVRCLHHAIVIVADLEARVSHHSSVLRRGDCPIAMVTRNIAAIERRYESLLERDLYRHLPGKICNQIMAISGSVHGMIVASDVLASLAVPGPNGFLILSQRPTEASNATSLQFSEELKALALALREERLQMER